MSLFYSEYPELIVEGALFCSEYPELIVEGFVCMADAEKNIKIE